MHLHNATETKLSDANCNNIQMTQSKVKDGEMNFVFILSANFTLYYLPAGHSKQYFMQIKDTLLFDRQ